MANDTSDGAVGPAARLMNADLVTPPALASTSTVVKALVALVVMGKLAELLPAGRLTVGGTSRTAGLRLVKFTTPPPAGGAGTTRTERPAAGLRARLSGLRPDAASAAA